MTLSEHSLQIAITQDHVCEQPKGSNGGPEVTAYLKSVGLGAGNPWCMAFVYWCVNQASMELGVKNPLIRTGSVMFQYNNTTCRKVPPRSSSVKPGDIFIMKFKNGTGHTGFVVKVANGIVYTIEGNSNDDGSREGYEVIQRHRTPADFFSIIQLP